jgi:hypothetical protein
MAPSPLLGHRLDLRDPLQYGCMSRNRINDLRVVNPKAKGLAVFDQCEREGARILGT